AALRSRSIATNRSLPLASGSSTIERSCCRCDVRSRCWMSVIAVRASVVSALGEISRKVRPAASTVRTPSSVTSRYSVSVSLPSGSTSVYSNWGLEEVTAAPLRAVVGGHSRNEVTVQRNAMPPDGQDESARCRSRGVSLRVPAERRRHAYRPRGGRPDERQGERQDEGRVPPRGTRPSTGSDMLRGSACHVALTPLGRRPVARKVASFAQKCSYQRLTWGNA